MKHMYATLVLASIFQFSLLSGKMLVIALSSDADCVDLHHHSFKKFCTDPFDYLVLNRSSNSKTKKAIEAQCKKLGIASITPHLYYSYYPPYPNVNTPHVKREIKKAKSINYALEKYGYAHKDTVVLIDSRVFLIKPTSIEKYMTDIEVAWVAQRVHGIEFFWPGFVVLRMDKLKDREVLTFDFNHDDLRAGFFTYYYLATHPKLRSKKIDITHTNLFSTSMPTTNAKEYILSQEYSGVKFLADGHFIYCPNPSLRQQYHDALAKLVQ